MTSRLNFVQANRTDELNATFYDVSRVREWTLGDFRSIEKTLDAVPDGADSLVIVPAADGEELHDSGYRNMSLVFFGYVEDPSSTPAAPLPKRMKLLGRSTYGHDHLQFLVNPQPEGRGYGPVTASGWEQVEFDCLPGSGLLRAWIGTNNGFARSLLLSTAQLRPIRTGPDDLEQKTTLHYDQLKDIQRTMMEWGRRFDHAALRVALDAAMEGK